MFKLMKKAGALLLIAAILAGNLSNMAWIWAAETQETEAAGMQETEPAAETEPQSETAETQETESMAETEPQSETAEMQETESVAETEPQSETAGTQETEAMLETVETQEPEVSTETQAQTETDARSEIAADEEVIVGFEGFDMYSMLPYETVRVPLTNQGPSFVLLPAMIKLQMMQSDSGFSWSEQVFAQWQCAEQEVLEPGVYRFDLVLDEGYTLSESLGSDIKNGAASLPYVEVIVSGVQTRSFDPNAQNPAVIVNHGLVYIPGTTTSTYDFTVNGRRAFCMQHPVPSAADGTVVTPAIYDDENIQKVLYYGYEGVEPYDGFSSDAEGIVLTSLALSYFYMGDFNFAPTWTGGAYGDYARQIGFTGFLEFVINQPYKSGIVDMSFSKSEVKAFIKNGQQVTEEIRFNYVDGEYVTIPLSEGMTLVNVTRNTYSTDSAVVYGGDTFYLCAPISQSGSYQSGEMIGSVGRYAPMLCLTGMYTQDVGYGSWVEDRERTVSLSVTWSSGRDVEVLKVDGRDDTPLAGARLQLKDSADRVLDTWESTASPRIISGLEVGKKYTVSELMAPQGYLLMDTLSFTLDAGEGAKKIILDNFPTEYHFIKVDKLNQQELSGAILKLSEKKSGKMIAQWTSAQNPHEILRLVPGTRYLLSEVTPARGYATADNIEFTVSDSQGVQTVTMVDDYTKIEIIKTDLKTKQPVAGAKLEVRDKQGNVIDTWVSDGKAHRINQLVVGASYILCEVLPAPGYVTAADVEFTVKDTADVQIVEMKDDHTKVDVIKTDSETKKPVAGAVLAVYKADESGKTPQGECLKTWTSTKEAYRLEYLPVGNYILREISAPESQGYVKAADVPFTIGDSAAVVRVEMKDDHTKVDIYKTDEVTKEPVVGAKLAIYPVDGKGVPDLENCLDTWVTDGKPHHLEYVPAGNYILRELEAPVKEGYATSADVAFTVAAVAKLQKVEMKDGYTKVHISKQAKENQQMLSGAHLQVIDADKKVVDEWVSDGSVHEILRLSPGKTYTLIETKPPAGYMTSDAIAFTVKDTTDIQNIVMTDEITRVLIEKQDKENGEILTGARLRLLDMEGNIIEEWISEENAHEICGLIAGERYRLVEAAPPDGYATAETVEFTVKDREIQTIAMEDEPTKILVQKMDARSKLLLAGAVLELKDDQGNIVSSWTSAEDGQRIERLSVGKTYTIEEKEAPENYALGEPINFIVEDTGEIQNVVLVNERIPVSEVPPVTPKTGEMRHIGLAAAICVSTLVAAAGVGLYYYKYKRRK